MSFSPFASNDALQVPLSIQQTVRELKLKELRVELKSRGLSPSGLKRDLMKRLEEALTGEADPALLKEREQTLINTAKRKRQADVSQTATSNRPTQARKRRRRRSDEDDDEDEEDDEDDPGDDVEDEIEISEGEDQMHEDDREEGEEGISDYGEDEQSESSESVSNESEEEEMEESDVAPSILSGRTFAKAVTHPTQSKGQVKSLEKLAFFGDTFVFTHQFWADSQLIRDITITGGTFKTLPHIPIGTTMYNRKEDEKEKGKGASKPDGSECRVILHWPPVGNSRDLRQHSFNITYSHLFLINEDSLSNPPHFKLLSKHSAVFLEES